MNTRETASGSIYVGIGGWNYDPWRETFYPKDVAKKNELSVREHAGHGDRDQRHLLPHAEPCELRALARRDARRLPVHGEGVALRDQSQGARRRRRFDRLLRRQRARGARRQARPAAVAVHADEEVRRGRLRGLPRAAAEAGRLARAAARARRAPRELSLRGVRRARAASRRGDRLQRLRRLSDDRRRHGGLRLRAADARAARRRDRLSGRRARRVDRHGTRLVARRDGRRDASRRREGGSRAARATRSSSSSTARRNARRPVRRRCANGSSVAS